MATRADPFAAHCVELLSPLGVAQAKRMFGGHGLYLDGLMIGLIADEQLYFKTDEATRSRWQAAGGQPFVYRSTREGVSRNATMSYWTPPAEATESAALMQPWARLALEAALRARAARKPAVKRAGVGKPPSPHAGARKRRPVR